MKREALLVRAVLLSPVLLTLSASVSANPTAPNVVTGSALISNTLPSGSVVSQGQATINVQGNVLTVTNSPGAVINWQNFSIGSSAIANFVQQSASSAVLNRVVTQNVSNIAGTLQSNGRVFLVNPNGVLFSAGAQVNTAAFTASTTNISDANFLAGNVGWSGSGVFLSVEGPMSMEGGTMSISPLNIDVTGTLNAPVSLTINTPPTSGASIGVPALTSVTVSPGTIVTSNVSIGSAANPLNLTAGNITTNGPVSTSTSGGAITLQGNSTSGTTTPPVTTTGVVTTSSAPTTGVITAGAGSSPPPQAPRPLAIPVSTSGTPATRVVAAAMPGAAANTGTTTGGGNTVTLAGPSTTAPPAPSVAQAASPPVPRSAAVATISLQKREPLF